MCAHNFSDEMKTKGFSGRWLRCMLLCVAMSRWEIGGGKSYKNNSFLITWSSEKLLYSLRFIFSLSRFALTRATYKMFIDQNKAHKLIELFRDGKESFFGQIDYSMKCNRIHVTFRFILNEQFNFQIVPKLIVSYSRLRHV